MGPFIAACSSGGGLGATVKRSAFSTKEFGVKVSPRVTNNPNPPAGGGRYLVGNAYTVRGKTYTPREQPDYVAIGKASWYGSDFHGRYTANGEIFSANAITGAHPTLPLPSYVRVTNLENGRSLLVRVNDRGPYLDGKIMDLSHRAAELLGFVNAGTAQIQVNYVSPAPLNGDDRKFLLASYNQPTQLESYDTITRLAMMSPDTTKATKVQVAAKRDKTNSLADMASDMFSNIFSYAPVDAEQENTIINSAHDAANAMATRSLALEDWVASVDEDARSIKLQLGVFTDRGRAQDVAVAFALLGAVDEESVMDGGRDATRLVMTKLKAGVARSDVLNLANSLGLTGLVLN